MKLALVIIAVTPVFADFQEPVVANKIKDRFIPAPYESQKIGGLLARRMRVNLEGRLLHVDEALLLAGFQKRPGSHPWIGEHIGKYLHAAVNTWRYTHDERLKTQMDRMVRALIATQLPGGYLGTYASGQQWTSWDVWVHKYNLIGLLSYYEATGYDPALAAARKAGDLLARTFGDKPGQLDLVKHSTHVGMAASSVLEPVVMLYRHTGEARYLDFAKYIVRSWSQPHGPRIIESLNDTGSVFRTANAKAYEMMSCLAGLVELYRVTGDSTYLKTAQLAWDDIRDKRLYITGTTSSHERFTDDHVLPGGESDEAGEGCATVTWLQLSWQLLRVSGEHKYADELERTVYNQLLGAQMANGDICYFTPLYGTKRATPGINCCVSSEPRGISMIPQLAWGTIGDATAILFYAPGELRIGSTRVISNTTFPDNGRVKLSVENAPSILLRVPYWTASFKARSAGKTYSGKAGDFVRIDKPGSEITIDMDMTVHQLSGGPAYKGFVALQRGPQVLALDAGINDAVEYLHRAAVTSDQLTPQSGGYEVDGITLTRDLKKQPAKLKLIPFADARQYRVLLATPGTLATGRVSLTAFGREIASRRGAALGSIADERIDTYRDTASGTLNGNEDWFAVELSRPVDVRRVVFRHGRSTPDGGWFEDAPKVQVKTEANGDWRTVAELASYRGGPELQPGEVFDVRLAERVHAYAIRVIGKPGKNFVTCAELEAYSE